MVHGMDYRTGGEPELSGFVQGTLKPGSARKANRTIGNRHNPRKNREKRTRTKREASVGQTLIFLGAAGKITGNGRDGGVIKHNGPLQRNLQHFIHGLDRIYRETSEDLLGDVRQVLLIVLRKQDGTQAHSVGGEEFFLDAADGENLAAQSDFTGHGHIAADGDAGEGADDGGADGDARGRAVLGNGAFGDMHVNINVAVEILGQAELVGARAHVAHGGLRGFLHDVAKFASEDGAAFAFHDGGFDGEDGTADFGPGEAGGQADFVVLLEPEFAVFQDAEVFAGIGGGHFHFDGGAAVGDHLAGYLASDILDFAFEIADAGFVRVMADDVEQPFVGEGEIVVGEAGGFAGALDQEALGDFQLFLLGIAGQTENFHAILQRLRNGVQDVGGADEHD